MKVLAQAVNSKRTKLLINLFFKMKTKYILGALCLPAVFTACTNEEFLTENENQLAGKEAVNMVLAANYGAEDQADTRMVNNNGTFLWDNTDVLGATYLINSTSENKIYSNNKFVNTLTEASAQADFTTDATTVVGEYLFYYPYSTKMTNDLSGVQYSLAEPQEYDPTGEKMMKNNFMIAPKITVDGNEPGELTLPITMRSIYAYGTLNLKLGEILNVDGAASTSLSSVNIQKIIIKYATSSNVHKNGKINMANVPDANLKAANLKSLREGNDPKYKGKSDAELRTILLAEADAELTAYNANYAQGTVLNLTTGTTTIDQVSIACVTEEAPNGVTLSKNGTFSTRVLLPTVTSSNLTIDVYTNVGKCELTATAAKIKPNHTVNLANPNRNGAVDSFTMTQFTAATDVNAISEADFIASMQQFVGQGTKSVNVTVGNFDLTPAAINAIPSNVNVIFKNAVSFSGDMTLENMTLAANTTNVVKSGKVTLKSVSFGVTSKFEVKDGELVVAGVAAGNEAVYVVNGGKLTVNHTNANNEAVATNIYSIDAQNGTVDIETPIVVNASGSFTVGASATVNNNATINKISSVVAKGVVNNNGTATVDTNAGTINNDGTLTVTTNNGTINQMSKNAVIANCTTNNSKIVTVAYSQTTVGTNDGEIVYVDNARIKTTSGNGNVTYVTDAANDANFGSLSSAITKVIITKDFTCTAGNTLPVGVTALEFQGNLTLSKDWSMSNVSAIAFTGATANITGGKTITGNGTKFTLTVGVDADQAAGIAAVATDLYIGPNVTITKLSAAPDLNGGARVWNDGTVKGTSAFTVNGWSGNGIVLG